jgi:hypothetical protein
MNLTKLAYDLAIYSLPLFGVVLFVGELVAKEIGVWLARRFAGKTKTPPEGVSVIVGSMMGLLAFVLALTLSFSNSRFNERLDGTIQEANAIGTAWLRAKAIGDPRGEQIARQLEDYTRLRVDYVSAPPVQKTIDAITAETSALQSRIWADLSAIIRDRSDPVAASLMSAINQTFDQSSLVRFAFEKRLPGTLFWLLITMTLLTMGCLGFQLGLRARPLRLMGAVLAAMWAAVIVDIIDLAATRLGTFRTPAVAYEWNLEGYQPAPPTDGLRSK